MLHCHGATLVDTVGSALLAAWFGGTRTGHADVRSWLARLQAEQWFPPIRIARVPGVRLWNPVLFRDRRDAIWLWYKAGPTVAAWTGAHIRSTDDGYTWSPPVYLPAGLLGPSKNKPIILSNGDVLCGTSAETWNSWACWLERSSDGGMTWQKYCPICAPLPSDGAPPADRAAAEVSVPQVIQPDNFAGVIQPVIWEYAARRLKMLMRATRRVGRICQSTSDDMGYTWSAAQRTDLQNPNSGLEETTGGTGVGGAPCVAAAGDLRLPQPERAGAACAASYHLRRGQGQRPPGFYAGAEHPQGRRRLRLGRRCQPGR